MAAPSTAAQKRATDSIDLLSAELNRACVGLSGSRCSTVEIEYCVGWSVLAANAGAAAGGSALSELIATFRCAKRSP